MRCVPDFKLSVQGDSPVLVVRILKSLQFFQVVEGVPKFSSDLVALLTILEHGSVDQPLEVGNSFSADEETLGTKHFLLENGLDVALRGGSEVAHSLTCKG